MDDHPDEQRDTNAGLDVSQRHPVFMSLPNADAPPRKPRHAPPPPPPVMGAPAPAMGAPAMGAPAHNEYAYPDGVGDLQGSYARTDSGVNAFANSKTNGRGGCVFYHACICGACEYGADAGCYCV